MPRSVLRLTLVIALLAAPLGGPASAAVLPDIASVRGAVWAFLSHLLPGAAIGKAGCQFDPYGQCIEQSPNRAGCTPDPFGQCIEGQPSPNKAGCRFDPFGGCLPGL